MGEKLTDQQEIFAQNLIKGKSQRQAYYDAYPNSKKWQPKTVDIRACRLCKKEHIKERLRELREIAVEETQWTVERLIGEFVSVKEKCMQETPVLVYNKETKEYEETGEYVFKEAGVIKALENIGKLLGHYEDKIKHSGKIENTNPFEKLTTDELKKFLKK